MHSINKIIEKVLCLVAFRILFILEPEVSWSIKIVWDSLKEGRRRMRRGRERKEEEKSLFNE